MFRWNKDFELGIESIDRQHKKIFELGNRVYELLTAKKEEIDHYDDILNIMNELTELMTLHFETEENLFKKYNYPGTKEHMEEHDIFGKYLQSIREEDLLNQELFLKDLFEKLADEVFNHILNTDFLYKDYLISLGKSNNIL